MSAVRSWFDRRDGLPPGPPLPSALQTAAYALRPIELMERCSRRYGDAFTLRFHRFVPEVFFSHPDAIKEIFTGDPEIFAAGKANAPFLGPLVGESSLLLLDGARHLEERKLMLPPFHGERMQSYAESMREIANAEIDRWPTGVPISMRDRMLRITFDVILRTVFGLGSGARVTELSETLAQVIELGSNPLWLLPSFRLDLGVLTPWGRLLRKKIELDRLLLEEIARRRKEALEGRTDVLSMLIGARYEDGTALSDLELRDEMITLLAAGHETTATALAWTIFHLTTNPEVHRRCREAARSSASGARLEYLDATIKESLRLTPVIPAVGRILERPARVGGFDLPAGVEVVPVVYLTHRRPDVWPEPKRFRPERFLESRPSPYEFLPFGGGVRRCIGMPFALFEMNIVLSEILRRTDLVLRPGYEAKTEQRSITFTPKGGVEVMVERATRA